MVSHVAAAFFSGFVIYTAIPGSSLFSWHPTCMAIAFALLMFEGIVIFSRESSLMWSFSRAVRSEVHGYVMVVAAVLAAFGFLAVYYNKNLNDKPHFTSWHGLVGVLSLGYIVLQIIGGVSLKYFFAVSSALKLKTRRVDMKLYHATSGLVAFSFISCSLLLALWSNWFISQAGDVLWWLSFGCLSCIAIIVMNQITSTYLPQTQGRLVMEDTIPQKQTRSQTRKATKRK